MALYRINKYSRQIVCQDIVLSCQSKNIQQIPLFKRAATSGLSLHNPRAALGGLSSARDLDVSGMLVNWHLWNQRGVPLSHQRQGTSPDRVPRSVSERRDKVSRSSLTLRKESLCVAIEKYLLFLMPRNTTRKRVLHAREMSPSHRDCARLSALYVHTALGLRQYLYESGEQGYLMSTPQWKALSPGRMRFPHTASSWIDASVSHLCDNNRRVRLPPQLLDRFALTNTDLLPSRSLVKAFDDGGHTTRQTLKNLSDSPRSRGVPCHPARRPVLSLHCPSLLNSPDMQDIAQSGFMTLEGHVTLELS